MGRSQRVWEEAGGWFHATGPGHRLCPASAGSLPASAQPHLPGQPARPVPWSLNASFCTSLPPPTVLRARAWPPPFPVPSRAGVRGLWQGVQTSRWLVVGPGQREPAGAGPGEGGLAEDTRGAGVGVTPSLPSCSRPG